MEWALYIFPSIAFLAFFLKTVTGFGTAIILISLGVLLLEPQFLIPVSAILDGIGGGLLLHGEKIGQRFRFWGWPSVFIIIGSVVGAFCLKIIEPKVFKIILTVVLLALSFWFLGGRNRGLEQLKEDLPEHSSKLDILISFIAGFLGGLVGMSGPPLIWHFGRRYAKRAFREALLPILFASSIARITSYSYLGLVERRSFLYISVAVPGVFLGIFLGNKVFEGISENHFSKFVGLILLAVVIGNWFKM